MTDVVRADLLVPAVLVLAAFASAVAGLVVGLLRPRP